MASRDRRDTENISRRGPQSSLSTWRDPYASSSWSADPFSQLRRLTDQMDRWFDQVAGRSFGRSTGLGSSTDLWAPQIETFLRNDQFVIRVDLPGMNKDDVTVEVAEDRVVIQGQREQSEEENREGFYRSERTYGRFYREVPLPEGALPETAQANYRDGVLEITATAPPQEVSRPRRIEIGDAKPATTQQSAKTSERSSAAQSNRAVAREQSPRGE